MTEALERKSSISCQRPPAYSSATCLILIAALFEANALEVEPTHPFQFPRITGQARLAAALSKELNSVPSALRGDLREEEPAGTLRLDENPVAADLDIVDSDELSRG